MKYSLLSLLFLQICHAADAPLEATSLWRFIRAEGIRSIDELIPRLPATFRNQSVLLYHSESVMEGSPENPRAILYSENPAFVLTFNGSPEQSEHDAMEIFQLNPERSEFEFFRLSFPVSASAPEKNPNSCKQCHGNPSRPVWAGYSLWPGVYGSTDTPSVLEMNYLRDFQRNQRTHPRYRVIPVPNLTSGVSPAQALGKALQAMNDEVVYHTLISRYFSVLNPYRFAIGGILGCMGVFSPYREEEAEALTVSQFIPQRILNSFNQSYESLWRDTLHRHMADYVERAEKQRSLAGSISSDYVQNTLNLGWGGNWHEGPAHAEIFPAANLRYLFNNIGVPVLDFSIERNRATYLFHGDGSFLERFRELWLGALDLRPGMSGLSRAQCEDLKQRSLDSLSRIHE